MVFGKVSSTSGRKLSGRNPRKLPRKRGKPEEKEEAYVRQFERDVKRVTEERGIFKKAHEPSGDTTMEFRFMDG